MAVDKFPGQRLERLAVRVERGNRLLAAALAGTDIGLFVRHEVGRGKESMLEIVDAGIDGLAVGN